MGKIEDIRKNKPHCVLLAMCLEPRWKPVKTGPVASAFLPCHKRWFAIVEPGTTLLKLECPECGAQNSFASVMPTDYSAEADHG